MVGMALEREIIQWITFTLTISTIVILVLMVRDEALSWRYALLPSLVLLQIVVFYLYVFFMSPSPSETVTTWSAVLRLEMVLSFFMVLIAYWKNSKHNG
jgi:heme/copper-type cytochrome/quinol oxidase subunit 4